MPTTRRLFLGTAGALAALGAAWRRAEEVTPTRTPPPSSPTPTPSPAARALLELARERYGKYLEPEEIKMLDEEMASLERRSARLRAIRLANSEEPATDFRTVRR